MKYISTWFLLFIILSSCSSQENFQPKPYGYHRIELPEQKYNPLQGDFPYFFEVSEHAEIVPDTSFMSEPYWIEVDYPSFNASINFSYKDLPNHDSLVAYVNASSKLTHKHNVRSVSITEYPIRNESGLGGVVAELEGEVPSFFQFWLTDSTDHFVRAALYFPTSERADSLAPVIEYMKLDMIHMLNTLKFRE